VAGIITSKVKNLVICLALLEVLKTMRQFPAAAERRFILGFKGTALNEYKIKIHAIMAQYPNQTGFHP
jgi:hypothetical protein